MTLSMKWKVIFNVLLKKGDRLAANVLTAIIKGYLSVHKSIAGSMPLASEWKLD